MKIMHVIVGLNTGGAEAMLRRLVMNMREHMHIIVSLTERGTLGQVLIADGHTVHALGMSPTTVWPTLRQLWRLIRQTRPDVIQTWMYHADLLGGLLGRFAGVRNIVWNVRNTEIPQGRFSVTGIVICVCASLSRVIPRAIVCCADAGLDSHAALGYSRDRMVVIPNGYETQTWKPPSHSKSDIRTLYGLPLDSFIIGIVGRFDPLKGYDVFVEAAGLMTERSRHQFLFVMVGRSVDRQNSALRTMILSKGGHAHFKLMGEQKDIAQIMYSLDVLCLASKAEGFPNVVAEAMLMEVPCVVTDVGDARQIVGQTGIVIPANKPSLLADALLALEGMEQKVRYEMGCAARRRIVELYDIDIILQRYVKLYEWPNNT